MSCTFECDTSSQPVNVPVRQVVWNKRMDRKSLSDPPNKGVWENTFDPRRPAVFPTWNPEQAEITIVISMFFKAEVGSRSHFCLELVQLTVQFEVPI